MFSNPIRRGQFIRRKGIVWKIVRLDRGMIHLSNEETGELDRIAIQRWQLECSTGDAEMVPDPALACGDEHADRLVVPLRDMPEKAKHSVEMKMAYVQAFYNPTAFYEASMPETPVEHRHVPRKLSKKKVNPLLRDVYEARRRLHPDGIPERKPPAFSTFCGWIRVWENTGERDARVLASLTHKRGPQKRRMSTQVEDWLNRIIDEKLLTTARTKRKVVYEELKHKVNEWNKAHPDEPVPALSERQTYRYIKEEIDQEVWEARRNGQRKADLKFRPVGAGPETTHILQRVEIDHTRDDVEVCDDFTDVILGRPWSTSALEMHSRAPMGLHVHFDGPSQGAILQCIRNCMLPKGFLREICPEINYDYPVCGRPEVLYMDHGSDFDTDHIRDVCLQFGIRAQYAPVGDAWYKGGIERYQRTYKENVSHPLPGAILPWDKTEDVRIIRGRPCVPFSRYVARAWFWLTMVYARSWHRGIQAVPIERWNESAEGMLPRPLPKEQDLRILQQRVEYAKPSNQGVVWKGLRWNGDSIRMIRAAPGYDGESIKILINEQNLGDCSVVDPVTLQELPVDPVLPRYMNGLTLYQHRMAWILAKERQGNHDEESLLEAKHFLRAQEELFMEASHKRTKGAANFARHRGIGSVAPAGDDPGSVIPPLAANDDDMDTEVASKAPAAAADPEPEPAPVPRQRVRKRLATRQVRRA